jgi:hypothetical protein
MVSPAAIRNTFAMPPLAKERPQSRSIRAKPEQRLLALEVLPFRNAHLQRTIHGCFRKAGYREGLGRMWGHSGSSARDVIMSG